MIDRIIQQIKKFLPFIIFLWLIVALFLAIDGISRNLYGMDINFFFKGIYNNRLIVFFPFLLAFLISLKRKRKSVLFDFLLKNSLVNFIVLLNISYLMKAFSYDYYLFYIVELLISFILFISLVFFLCKVESNLKELFLNRNLKDEPIDRDTYSFSKKEILLTIVLIIIFLGLRFYSLNGLHPTTDEYLHLLEAKSRLFPDGILYPRNTYTRASFLTWILEKLFSSFGTNVTVGRIPGVIISCITAMVFYLLIKKENKTFAVICSLLFVLSPWSIMLSRTIREYIFFLPISLLLSMYIYKRVNTILDKKYKWYYFLLDLFLTLILAFYSFKIDPSGTIKFSFVFYLIGFIYWFINFIKEKETSIRLKRFFSDWRVLVSIAALITVSTIANRVFGLSLSVMQVNILPSFNFSWIGYIFLDQSYGSLIFYGVFLLAGIFYSLKHSRNSGIDRLQIFSVTAFLVILYFFSFHFGRYYRPRYISLILPSLIILSGVGILHLRSFLSNQLELKQKSLLLFILLFINWSFVFYGFLAKGDGYVKVTYEFSEGMELVYDYLKDKDNGYVLITSLPEAADWYFDDGITKIFHFSYSEEDKEEYLDKIVSSHKEGYFVIDARRNEWGGDIFKEKETYITKSGYMLKYVKTIDYYLIFKWDR